MFVAISDDTSPFLLKYENIQLTQFLLLIFANNMFIIKDNINLQKQMLYKFPLIGQFQNIHNLNYLQQQFIFQKAQMQFVTTTFHSCRRKYYFGANKIMPFKKARWSFSVMIAALYFYRSYGLQYNVITYLIFFYMLQLLTDYITPKGLSNIDEDDSNQIPQIQTMLRDDFQYVPEDISQKPLVSQINEYQVWERVLLAFTLGLICTMFKAIQIDVFWPLLMVYFVGLVIYTVQKIVKKMKKYRYSLSDFTKKPDLL